jgi:hypothetical protein
MRYGVGFRGCKGWATEIFVQVCTADPDVSGGDLVESVMAASGASILQHCERDR